MSQGPRKNTTLEELKRALETAETVMVDENGRLISEQAMQQAAFEEKRGGTGALQTPPTTTRVKPTRWF